VFLLIGCYEDQGRRADPMESGTMQQPLDTRTCGGNTFTSPSPDAGDGPEQGGEAG
jgi:hypothetical protein